MGQPSIGDKAHRFLDWAREEGAGLDSTDASVWFVQGALQSMAARPDDEDASLRTLKCASYAVYLAETLAATCRDVQALLDEDNDVLREVRAVQGDRARSTLSWVLKFVEDPTADNVVVKYAEALRDFGEHDRAGVMDQQLTQLANIDWQE